MERHTRHDSTSHAPRRPRGSFGRTALGLAGLILLAGLSGCGHEASTEQIIFLDAADANWTLPDNYGNGINSIAPVQPIMIQVQKSSDDETPVPGVDITLMAGGISIASPTIFDPVSGAVLDDGTGLLQTRTDDHGVVVILPAATVTGCTAVPAEDTSVSGNLSVGIFISSDTTAWNGNFTYTCQGP